MIIHLDLKERGYDIHLKRGILHTAADILSLQRKVLIVTDNGVPSEYSKIIAKQCKTPVIVTVKQGEDSKSLTTLNELYKVMLENGFTRKDCVVAVGGGVVGDLSGFAAATFMRGIDFYNIPTTVLSQVDSSIGGKVAVNFEGVKNIIGTFYQPKAVIIDPDVLKTLPARQISNGLAEAVKMGLTSDKTLFEMFENDDYLDNIDVIIEKSLRVKKYVVEQDEKETGLRKILNFGHTIGHAFESLNFGKLYHGECVALGMLYMCSECVKARLLPVLKRLNLPTEIDFNKAEALGIIKHDKKAESDCISAIFVEEIGNFDIKQVKPEDLIDLL